MKGTISKPRDLNHDTFYLTIIRAIATVAVVTLHIGSGSDTHLDIITRGIVSAINVWCVPAFFMITGALFICVKEDFTVKEQIERTARLLFIVLIWNFLYSFISLAIINKGSNIKILSESIKMAACGETKYGYHLWYLYTAVGIYLTLPILRMWLKRATKQDHLFYIGICCLLSLVIPSCMRIMSDKVTQIWNGAFRYFTGYITYVLIGAYLHRYKLSKVTNFVLYISGMIVVIIYVIIGFIDVQELYDKIGYESVSAAILTSAIFTGVKHFEIDNRRGRKTISIIANYSFSIYLLHVMVIQVLRKVLNISSESAPLIISLPLLTGITITLCLLIAFLEKQFILKIKKVPQTWIKCVNGRNNEEG